MYMIVCKPVPSLFIIFGVIEAVRPRGLIGQSREHQIETKIEDPQTGWRLEQKYVANRTAARA
jgi:hypothetical protein